MEGRLVRVELTGFVDAEAARVATTVFTNAGFNARGRRGVAESSVEAAKKRRGRPRCSSIYSHNWQTGLGFMVARCSVVVVLTTIVVAMSLNQATIAPQHYNIINSVFKHKLNRACIIQLRKSCDSFSHCHPYAF